MQLWVAVFLCILLVIGIIRIFNSTRHNEKKWWMMPVLLVSVLILLALIVYILLTFILLSAVD